MSYLGHPTCLSLLLVAAAGFLSIQFQLLALDAIMAHAESTANSTITASTSSLTAKLNSYAANSSAQYASTFNAAVATYQDRIDNELFGTWTNSSLINLNTTLVEFYSGIESALNATFGGTVLFSPINTFIYCILGSKITNLEQGLTWVHDHAQLTLPTLPTNILMLSNSSMDEITTPIVAAAVGSGSSGDDGVVGDLIDHFESALTVERNFYAILLGIWLFFALVGLGVVIWHSGGSERVDRWCARHNCNFSWPLRKSKARETDEKRFRGVDDEGVSEKQSASHTDRSFLDTRPVPARSGTFGALSLSSLVAPGQAFLRLNPRSSTASRPVPPAHELNSMCEGDNPVDRDILTPQPFWVNKFYRAVETASRMFPTRGQKLGAAIQRNTSQRTERSFGASQLPSALPTGQTEWIHPDPETIGHAVGDSRYPSLAMYQAPMVDDSANSWKPRPMSRAPTLPEGTMIPRTRRPNDPFADTAQDPFQQYAATPNSGVHHYSDHADDLPSAQHGDTGATPFHSYYKGKYDEDGLPDLPRRDQAGHMIGPTSPASSGRDLPEARVERVKTGTAALAAVIAGMQRRKASPEGQDPFEDEEY